MSSLNNSALWEHFCILKLTQNMRINLLTGSEKNDYEDFSKFLLNIGEGKEKTYTDKNGNHDCIKINESILRYNDEIGMINTVYPGLAE